MKFSVSNLAWSLDESIETISNLVDAGISGVEVAPTVVWSDAPHVMASDVRDYLELLNRHGLVVSGIQSLLFGHPELNLFNKECWPDLQEHLVGMFRVGSEMGAEIAVFGSPRNRRRETLPVDQAMTVAADFLSQLVPELRDNGIVLVLEPNAPDYGADFLITYEEVVELVRMTDSEWIRPVVDSGCLTMVGVDPAQAVIDFHPAHVHVSEPNLVPPPDNVDHTRLRDALIEVNYDGWVVLEMLGATTSTSMKTIGHAKWMTETYRRRPVGDGASS